MGIKEIFDTIGTAFLSSLPLSPFSNAIESLDIPYLSYFNWFFPIGDFIVITGVWLTSITLIYFYSVVLKWLKILGD